MTDRFYDWFYHWGWLVAVGLYAVIMAELLWVVK
jgi:hypothetical protein